MSSRWRETALAAAILAVAALLRLGGLDEQSLWHDEVSTLAIAARPLPDMLALNLAADVNPPLSYAIFNPWVRLCRSEAWVRLLPALLGLAAVFALYLFGRRLAGPRAAALGGLLLAVNPFHVYFSQELRYYSLLSLWGVLATWALLRWIERRDRRSQHIYVLAAAAAIWTHYFSLLLVAGHACLVLILGRRAPGWPQRLKAAVKLCLLCLPLALPIAIQVLFNRSFRYRQIEPLWQSLYDIFVNLSIGGPESRVPGLFPWIDALPRDSATFMLLACCLAAPLWLAATLGLISVKFRPPARLILACSAALPLLLALLLGRWLPLLRPNYLIGFVPLICLAAGLGLADLQQRFRPAAYGLLALTVLLSLQSIRQVRNDPVYFRDDWRAAAAELGRLARPDDLVLVYHDGAAGGFLHYYKGPAPVEYVLASDPFLFTQPAQRQVAAWLERDLRQHRPQRIWLVTSYADFFDPAGHARSYISERWIRDSSIDFRSKYRVEILLYYPDLQLAGRALSGSATEAIDLSRPEFEPLQLGRGFIYQPGDSLAWINDSAGALLVARGDRSRLQLSGFADVTLISGRPFQIEVVVNDASQGRLAIERSGLFDLTLMLDRPLVASDLASVELRVSPSFVPSELGFDGDARPKTIQLSRIALLP